MDLILSIAGILGGISALWFFWDKLFPKVTEDGIYGELEKFRCKWMKIESNEKKARIWRKYILKLDDLISMLNDRAEFIKYHAVNATELKSKILKEINDFETEIMDAKLSDFLEQLETLRIRKERVEGAISSNINRYYKKCEEAGVAYLDSAYNGDDDDLLAMEKELKWVNVETENLKSNVKKF